MDQSVCGVLQHESKQYTKAIVMCCQSLVPQLRRSQYCKDLPIFSYIMRPSARLPQMHDALLLETLAYTSPVSQLTPQTTQ